MNDELKIRQNRLGNNSSAILIEGLEAKGIISNTPELQDHKRRQQENIEAVTQDIDSEVVIDSNNPSIDTEKCKHFIQSKSESQIGNNIYRTPIIKRPRTQFTVPQQFSDADSAIDKLQKLSDECKISENEFDFFAKSLAN
ncbi:hypothetical protein ABEB36_000269 [Hypothenemus hampei]|uniref:Uncharacterized protein n=1 Tax=Hypothenemus hampei TaxID=57062 RepID=A0ABD1FBF7_HYPHA